MRDDALINGIWRKLDEPVPDRPDAKYEPCPVCPECQQPFTGHGGTSETCVGYYSPEGHEHDGNCMKREYRCANGHETPLALVRRCPAVGCEWKGKTECFCCARFVDEWPGDTNA